MLGFLQNDVTQARLLVVAGLAVFGLSDNMTRLVSEQMGLGQFMFMRSVFLLTIMALVSCFIPVHVRPKNGWAVLARSICFALAMYLFFATLSFVPAAIAVAGLLTSPIFVLIISAVFFNIIPGVRRIGAVILGSVGVWLIMNPSAHDFHSLQMLTLAAGAFYAMNNLITRHYCAGESVYSLLVGFFIVIGLVGGVSACVIDLLGIVPENPQAQFLLTGWVWPDVRMCLWLLVIALLSGFGGVLIGAGYQRAETSYVAIYEYSYLIPAGFFGWLFWGHAFTLYDLLGMMLIVATGIMINRVHDEKG